MPIHANFIIYLLPHHTSSGIYKTFKKNTVYPRVAPKRPKTQKSTVQLTSRPSHWGWQTTFLLGWRINRRLTGSKCSNCWEGGDKSMEKQLKSDRKPCLCWSTPFFDGNLYFFWPFTIPSLQVKPCEQVSATNLRWTLMTFAPGLRWWASKRGLKSRRSEWVHLQPQT
jgi:hypothetical protein